MENLSASQTANFMKRFRFRGATLRSVRIGNDRNRESSAVILITVLDTHSNQRVRLRLRIDGVEEFRLQRRPGPGLIKLTEAAIGWFGGVAFVNLDAYPVDGPAGVHDFRASDAFVAGRALSWELVPRRPQPQS